MENKIILYTIHCPKCDILEKKLNAKNINFVVEDDIKTLQDKGFAGRVFPLLEVDDQLMEYGAAIKWINTQGE